VAKFLQLCRISLRACARSIRVKLRVSAQRARVVIICAALSILRSRVAIASSALQEFATKHLFGASIRQGAAASCA
jgi:hypothetical protein